MPRVVVIRFVGGPRDKQSFASDSKDAAESAVATRCFQQTNAGEVGHELRIRNDEKSLISTGGVYPPIAGVKSHQYRVVDRDGDDAGLTITLVYEGNSEDSKRLAPPRRRSRIARWIGKLAGLFS